MNRISRLSIPGCTLVSVQGCFGRLYDMPHEFIIVLGFQCPKGLDILYNVIGYSSFRSTDRWVDRLGGECIEVTPFQYGMRYRFNNGQIETPRSAVHYFREDSDAVTHDNSLPLSHG